MSDTTTTPTGAHAYSCQACGARIEFGSGTGGLMCPYCGHRQEVGSVGTGVDTTIDEHDYVAWTGAPSKPAARVGPYVIACTGCGATLETDKISDRCRFCTAPVVVHNDALGLIVPEAVVPFAVDRHAASTSFGRWVRSRWFAPGALKKVGATESMEGTYLPHWTFDAHTETDYAGERGEHYWETETYTEQVDGRTETRTRQVQRTRWWPAHGHVQRDFDDVLVAASRRLPDDTVDKLGPWGLEKATPYQPDYLAGFQTLRYEIEPDAGLVTAQERMRRVVEDDCEHDIGGDEQRVHRMDVDYSALAFKLVLLPVWVAAYLYAGRTYTVYVNAFTGQVVGDRPYSKGKIAAAVLGVLALIGAAVWLYAANR